ncbi:MAG: glycosyltransferase family 2 protein [Ignavibacteriales bacterium]|nr:glycosyltransferase family 2 protein [Ignavibacteriales bacterium]
MEKNAGREAAYEPTITIIISIFNEEKVIRERIENLLHLNYASNKIQILIGSDGSNDRSNSIIGEYVPQGIQVIVFSNRRGKSSVINDLMKYATNDIVIFSDANTFYHTDVIKNLARHFCDKSIGGVCGYLQLRADKNNSGGRGESTYWEFENKIKQLEGDIFTTFGATGAIYAIRRECFVALPTHKAVADDFYIPMRVIEQGYRSIYDKNATSWEETTASSYKEFQRKIRIGAANFNSISDFKYLLHPKYGFIAYGLFSHKILRWFVPFFLILVVIFNSILLSCGKIYEILFFLQVIFVCLVIIGFILDHAKFPIKFFIIPYYFMVANVALLIGFIRFIRGSETAAWVATR